MAFIYHAGYYSESGAPPPSCCPQNSFITSWKVTYKINHFSNESLSETQEEFSASDQQGLPVGQRHSLHDIPVLCESLPAVQCVSIGFCKCMQQGNTEGDTIHAVSAAHLIHTLFLCRVSSSDVLEYRRQQHSRTA